MSRDTLDRMVAKFPISAESHDKWMGHLEAVQKAMKILRENGYEAEADGLLAMMKEMNGALESVLEVVAEMYLHLGGKPEYDA